MLFSSLAFSGTIVDHSKTVSADRVSPSHPVVLLLTPASRTDSKCAQHPSSRRQQWAHPTRSSRHSKSPAPLPAAPYSGVQVAYWAVASDCCSSGMITCAGWKEKWEQGVNWYLQGGTPPSLLFSYSYLPFPPPFPLPPFTFLPSQLPFRFAFPSSFLLADASAPTVLNIGNTLFSPFVATGRPSTVWVRSDYSITEER